MTQRPLLLLPQRAPTQRARRGGGGKTPQPLSPERQTQRLGPRLKELEDAFESKRVQVQTSTSGLNPEDVLVLETAGAIDEFFKAVSRVEGLEFLGEFDEEDIPPSGDFFSTGTDGTPERYSGRVYMVFANQEAFKQLLRLWNIWQSGDSFERGLTKWRDVFALLRDIRPWGLRDRLEETGILEDWAERVEDGSESLPCEIELWFRSNQQHRAEAFSKVREQVEVLGGQVASASECVIEAIHYHAFIAHLPISAVASLLDENTRAEVALVQCEQIQFFRASGQMVGRISLDNRTEIPPLPSWVPDPEVAPVVALFDGLPLQAHQSLSNRLIIDDPDGFSHNYQARARIHGTAMASLITWGDLNADRPEPLPQPLYVRPIMRPVYPPDGWDVEPYERVPEDVLIIDLIHRAVRRLFEDDADSPPVAPSISVINFSIGIKDRLFDGMMSPLAKLLDWLSWEYQVLFLVSAGNHFHNIDVGLPWSELSERNPSELNGSIIQAIAADRRNRSLLSPAEGMNVVTVGATHEDKDPNEPLHVFIDPLPVGYPSVINAQGLGYKRSVKPEILLPGGRVQVQRPLINNETCLSISRNASSPGHKVASPGLGEGDLAHSTKSRGTSNATAMASRTAAFLVPVLEELEAQEGGDLIEAVPRAVWLKALIVHGSIWGDLGQHFRELLRTNTNSRKLAEHLTRLLGYGVVGTSALQECTQNRVTALSGGMISANSGFEHRFPLPPSLSGQRGWRKLTVTLAWMTPINPINHRWRCAHLWFKTPSSRMRAGSGGHIMRTGVDWQATQRGTVQHEVFEGERAAAFVDGDEIVVQVSCREDAGALNGEVGYALVITLEVAPELGLDIYSEIKERVQTRLRVAAGA